MTANGVPAAQAHELAHGITAGGASAEAGSAPAALVHAIQVDIAHSTQTVVFIMAGLMAAAFVVAKLGLQRGRVEEPVTGVALEAR